MLIEKIRKDAMANRLYRKSVLDEVKAGKDVDHSIILIADIQNRLYTTIVGALKQIEVDQRREATDADAEGIISSFVKDNRANQISFTKVGNTDKIFEAKTEYDILLQYLPEQYSGEKLKALIEKIVQEQAIPKEPASMRLIMGVLKNDYKDTYDGKEASAIANAVLKG